MTDSSLSAYPTSPGSVPRPGLSLHTPGLQLMSHLDLRGKLRLLLLCTWLPLVLCAALVWGWPPQGMRPVAFGVFGVDALAGWAPLGLLAAAVLAALYLTACAWRAVFADLDLLRRSAQDLADGHAPWRARALASDEIGQALDAFAAAGEQLKQLRDAASRSARELADAHRALQLDTVDVRAAVGEMSRRTIALCGMLDSNLQDAERAGTDLEAIQDEERNALQLMAVLRARLLVLAQHCHGLGEAAGGSKAGLAEAASVEITQCHQLSERVGGAERMNERRIESMRRSADSMVSRADRGMREAQQLMMLARRIEAAQAAAGPRLDQLAAWGAALDALGRAPLATAQTRNAQPEASVG